MLLVRKHIYKLSLNIVQSSLYKYFSLKVYVKRNTFYMGMAIHQR